jgi:hypothetical protein
MSLPDEKYRAVRRIPYIIRALLNSKKNRIARAWKEELYYALKHYPWDSDEVIVDGYSDTKKYIARTYEDIHCYVESVDNLVGADSKKAKRKKKKK